MKNTKKRIITIVMVVAMFLAFTLPVLAGAVPVPKPDGGAIDGDMQSLAGKAIGIAQFIGIGIAVVMLIFYGVRYFTADPAKQGDLKKALWGYLIGAVCIFGAVIILEFIKGTVENANI